MTRSATLYSVPEPVGLVQVALGCLLASKTPLPAFAVAAYARGYLRRRVTTKQAEVVLERLVRDCYVVAHAPAPVAPTAARAKRGARR